MRKPWLQPWFAGSHLHLHAGSCRRRGAPPHHRSAIRLGLAWTRTAATFVFAKAGWLAKSGWLWKIPGMGVIRNVCNSVRRGPSLQFAGSIGICAPGNKSQYLEEKTRLIAGVRSGAVPVFHDYREWPSVSSDGSKIVFESTRSGADEVWMCRSDGRDLIQLTQLNSVTGTPAVAGRTADWLSILVLPAMPTFMS